ncbi:MAG: sulfite exporter TauE/SafE family protein [Gammaproteobacteria bacterium]|nr:sulfite exporter TauE/SafE family protein [Gammaproteobacteria bacterium]
MILTDAQQLLCVVSGSIVGFSLGLIGGGGSILAVPLLIYVVGVRQPHVVIGTTALAVALNAFANLVPHARRDNVRWREGWYFAVAGGLGALAGAAVGKRVDGHALLFLFSLLMLFVAVRMARPIKLSALARTPGYGAGRVAGTGFGVGVLAGFFGIGGGFLVVPGLVKSTGMRMLEAVGTSLLAVGVFGLTTTISYAASGLVSWRIGVEFLFGGVIGGWAGASAASHIAQKGRLLNYIFSGIVALVGLYMAAAYAGDFVALLRSV